jgi:Protein of unknown function (DUF2452)
MSENNTSEEKKPVETVFVNPIDKDKVAQNPGLLEYAHTVGGAIIRPLDKGRMRGQAMAAMYEQTSVQLEQIKQQVELLMAQADKIHNRLNVSELIYKADIGFKPIISRLYHLYERANGKLTLSMVSPNEWGRKMPFKFVASVKLLSDHTWDIIDGEVGTEFVEYE